VAGSIAFGHPERRVSDKDREAAVDVLSHGCGEGYLSADTLARRIDGVYAARRRFEILPLLSDLPLRSLRDRLVRRLRARPPAAVTSHPLRLTPPPARGDGPFDVGRASDSDLLVDDPTVSSLHATLHRRDGDWVLRDEDSRNGTRVNGWRVEEATLHDGDLVQLGRAVLVFEAER